MNKTLLAFLTGLMLLMSVGFWAGKKAADAETQEKTEDLKKLLVKSLAAADLPSFGVSLSRQIFRQVGGLAPDDPRIPAAIDEVLRGLPRTGIKVALLDHFENMIWPGKRDDDGATANAYEVSMKMLGTRWFREKGLRPPFWRSERTLDAPEYLPMIFFDEKIDPGKVAGILLVLEITKFNQPFLLNHALTKLRQDGHVVGLWDRLRLKGTYMPRGLSRKTLNRSLSRVFRTTGNVVPWRGKNLVVVPHQGTMVLLGTVTPAGVAIPGWFSGLMVLWSFFCLYWMRMGKGRLSLGSFLNLAIALAAGLPLALTLVFWFFFYENRVTTLTNDVFKEMEQNLVNIDYRLPEDLRGRRNLLNETSRRMEAEPEKLSFHLDAISTMEMTSYYFDHFMMVSSSGAWLRDFSLMDASMRRLIATPKAKRLKKLQNFVDQGFIPYKQDVELAMTLTPGPEHITQYWTSKPNALIANNLRDGVKVLGKMLIGRFNQMSGNIPPEEEGKDKSELVYGSMIDSQTGDLIQRALSTLGDMMRLGSGMQSAWAFIDILKGPSGLAEYAVVVFSDIRNIELGFLGKMFRQRGKWPEQVSYAAESNFMNTFFPERPKKHLLRRYYAKLILPRCLISEVTMIGGEKMLLSAFACRNLRDFILFAVTPWSVVEQRQKVVRQKMAVLVALMLLLIIGITWRLRRDVVAPAQSLIEGVHAMETKRLEHRIPLQTGDEWDEIADSFNNALASMEELEVARVVQTLILPAGVIQGKRGRFLGRSAMTGEVGGDYYDAIANDDGSLNFVIGDVTGHGVSAALVVAMAKSAFHIIHRQGVRAPAEVLNRMNRLVVTHLSKKKALTMQVGLLMPDGRLFLASAGHPFPYLLIPGSRAKELEQIGFPLGASIKSKYVDQNILLERYPHDGVYAPKKPGMASAFGGDPHDGVYAPKKPGMAFAFGGDPHDGACSLIEQEKAVILEERPARLVMYTDGIIEQMNPDEEPFGIEGFQKALDEAADSSSEELIAHVHARLREFCRGRAWDDDVSIAILEIDPETRTTEEVEEG